MQYKYHESDQQMQKQIMAKMAGKEVEVSCHWCKGTKYIRRGDTRNSPDGPISWDEKCQDCDGEGKYKVVF